MTAARRREPGEVVDLADARKKKGGAYRIPCPKCGEPIYERATRCTHCGIWFDGEAFEFAQRPAIRGRARKGARTAFYILVAVAVLVFVLLLLGGI